MPGLYLSAAPAEETRLAALLHDFRDAGSKAHAIGALVGGIGVGKVATDVPRAKRAEDGVHDRV